MYHNSKVTLSFNAQVIAQAKAYAEQNGISLSRLTEILLRRLTSNPSYNIEDFPVSDWVNYVSEGKAEYVATPSDFKKRKAEMRSEKHQR
jgi:antitoxin component of RelBE/YafQ-DinJ toxin-antitoxin module